MEQSTRVGNRLLAALPPADFVLLAPYLRKLSLERDAVLVHCKFFQHDFMRPSTAVAPSDMRSRSTPGRCWRNSSTWPPAMRCTRPKPAWPGGCSTSRTALTVTSYR
jgi:hypothetical protein